MKPTPQSKTAAVIVAHPDDETLWAGGTILSQPAWRWVIISLCRASDEDRAPKFFKALQVLGAEGKMGDLDDGPEQMPLPVHEVEATILHLLPPRSFDILITHSPAGEYTRHLRHEEIGRAVIKLWYNRNLSAATLWTFAYEDGEKRYLPQPIRKAHQYDDLPENIWQKKYSIITETYGFPEDGFEARTTPRAEAFWQFNDPMQAQHWLKDEIFQHESSSLI